MRELSPDPRARDAHAPLWIAPTEWLCWWCPITPCSLLADNDGGVATTVAWLAGRVDGPDGRCGECGQKYVLAKAFEHVPSIAEQLGYTVEELLGGDPS